MRPFFDYFPNKSWTQANTDHLIQNACFIFGVERWVGLRNQDFFSQLPYAPHKLINSSSLFHRASLLRSSNFYMCMHVSVHGIYVSCIYVSCIMLSSIKIQFLNRTMWNTKQTMQSLNGYLMTAKNNCDLPEYNSKRLLRLGLQSYNHLHTL